ncbi:cation:proton antiporter [Thiocystis violacea]|uniref:cation:proton antiporter n=1 Tax=Thiocystis violacea TaxID=13725 RepID=UPI001906A98B|nr:monovalent cation/H(+) antiporter subunit G [Thiocystis violacea]MBK1724525.1 hypothetical protein [Thiocystis violacea]
MRREGSSCLARLHGPTKATTLGIGAMLIASSPHLSTQGDGLALHELLITVFLFMTAPVSANLLAKAALQLRARSIAAIPRAFRDSASDRSPKDP